jgi:GNAT superfamily N-acetyltransferase
LVQDADVRPSLHHLRDGTHVRLRAIEPADRERLVAGFEKLSPESRYRRFFAAVPRLTDGMLQRLTETDGWNHVAIGAEVVSEDPEERQGLGVAHFFRLPDAPDTAEVAVAVIDEKQGLGLGRLLLLALVEAAREREIRQFRASILRDNAPALALLESLGPPVTSHAERDCLVYDIPLPEPTQDPTEGLLFRFLKLAATGLQFVFGRLGGDD